MALYLIGDIQGCDVELGQLLERIDFSPSRDRLVILGDLVNRGPASADVLRRLMKLESAAVCLLGNHDIHLLALAAGASVQRGADTLDQVLNAPDRERLLRWLRHQRLAWFEAGMLMVHAGVPPQWSADQTLALASEIEARLKEPASADWLRQIYGDQPDTWSNELAGMDRLRYVVNALTRMRFCDANGRLELQTKTHAENAPPGFPAWFEHPHRKTASITVAFGHWSALGLLNRPDAICLDTGCAWGGTLSAMRMSPGSGARELIQIPCA